MAGSNQSSGRLKRFNCFYNLMVKLRGEVNGKDNNNI